MYSNVLHARVVTEALPTSMYQPARLVAFAPHWAKLKLFNPARDAIDSTFAGAKSVTLVFGSPVLTGKNGTAREFRLLTVRLLFVYCIKVPLNLPDM